MKPNINCPIVLLGIFSIIGSSFSALLLDFVSISPKERYLTSRDASVHRGLLLSLSSAQKNQICSDLFSEKFDQITKGLEEISLLLEGVSRPVTVTDEWIAKGEPVHPLIVKPIRSVDASYTPTNKQDIFFKCYLQNYPGQISAEMNEFYVSSAYHPGLMYEGSEWNKMKRNIRISMRKYILLSPEFVSLDQTDMERQYVTTRQTLRNLGEESAEYINLIENKDTISSLSPWQTFLLCSSIMLSPNHEDDRHQFPLKWLEYKKYTESPLYSKYVRKWLSFKNEDYKRERWMAISVCCVSSSSDDDNLPGISRNLFFTRDFSDQNSIYVMTEQNGAIFMTDYIKNIPILINAHIFSTDEPPYYSGY